jgi:hypothetical protein
MIEKRDPPEEEKVYRNYHRIGYKVKKKRKRDEPGCSRSSTERNEKQTNLLTNKQLTAFLSFLQL